LKWGNIPLKDLQKKVEKYWQAVLSVIQGNAEQTKLILALNAAIGSSQAGGNRVRVCCSVLI